MFAHLCRLRRDALISHQHSDLNARDLKALCAQSRRGFQMRGRISARAEGAISRRLQCAKPRLCSLDLVPRVFLPRVG